MVHSKAITNGDGIKLKRYATSTPNTVFYSLGNRPQMDMPWDNFGETVSHPDEWLCGVIGTYTQGAQKGAMGCTLNAFFYSVASHNIFLRIKIRPLGRIRDLGEIGCFTITQRQASVKKKVSLGNKAMALTSRFGISFGVLH